jgi:signal transduction histidine kinase
MSLPNPNQTEAAPALPPPEAPMSNLVANLPLGDLLALGAQLRADISPEALLQDVADAIRRSLGYQRVYVRLRNADTDELEACVFSSIPADEQAGLRATPLAPAAYQALLQPQYRISESFVVQNAEAEGLRQHRGAGNTLLVPLRGRGDRLIGAIHVEPVTSLGGIELQNVQVLEAIARQAGLALENARLAARTQRLLAKERLLVELGRDVSDTLDLDTILARTVERLKMEFQGGAVSLLNEQDEVEIVASVGRIDDAARRVRLRVGEGICGWVVREGLPFLSNDIWHETRVRPAARDVGTNQLIRSYIAVPLRTGGRVIGVLSVESDQVNAFTYEDVDLLEAVAAQVGGPISSARLYHEAQRLAEQVRRRNKYLEVINTLARMAVSTLDLGRLLATVTAEIQQGFGYGHVELYVVDEDAEELELVAQAGPEELMDVGYSQSLAIGLLGRAFRTATTVRVDDVRSDPDYYVNNMPHTRSELCVPLVASGRVLAILNLEARQPRAFTDDDVATLETAADVLASAIENARLYQRAQEAAVLEERSRLARDLHDSISQQLFSMTLTAQAARAQLDKNPHRTASQLERLQETASAALAEMRALIFQLRPPGLSEQGLIATLQQHVAMLRRREGLTIDLFVSGDERDARGIEQAMYRIAQEALNNVVKHAGACQVEVALDLTPEQVTMAIVDDGRGFEQHAVGNGNGRHLGLISMHERAAELGGRLEISSAPSAGTRITVIVPRGAEQS